MMTKSKDSATGGGGGKEAEEEEEPVKEEEGREMEEDDGVLDRGGTGALRLSRLHRKQRRPMRNTGMSTSRCCAARIFRT